jgi:hypothetical protein
MLVEIAVDGVQLPNVPVPYIGTFPSAGDEWLTEALDFGWYAPTAWGEGAWPLGDWPSTAVVLYDGDEDNTWALVSYVEKVMALKIFAAWDRGVLSARERRDEAVTEIVVSWWRAGLVPGPDDLPEKGWLPHHHGPYRA